MIILDILIKFIEVCIISSIVFAVLLFVAAWMRGEFKK